MNREDIKRIGHQVGLDQAYLADDSALSLLVYLERFATLVAAAEREACAQVCDDRDMGDCNREDMEARACAAAIRARKNT